MTFNFPIPEPPKKSAAFCTLLQFSCNLMNSTWPLTGGIPPCPSLASWLLPLHLVCHLRSNALQKLPSSSPGGKTKWDQANRPEAAHSYTSHIPVFPFPRPQWQGTQANVPQDSDFECVFSEQIACTQCRFMPLQRGHKFPNRSDGRKNTKKNNCINFQQQKGRNWNWDKFQKIFRFTDNSIRKVWIGTETP